MHIHQICPFILCKPPIWALWTTLLFRLEVLHENCSNQQAVLPPPCPQLCLLVCPVMAGHDLLCKVEISWVIMMSASAGSLCKTYASSRCKPAPNYPVTCMFLLSDTRCNAYCWSQATHKQWCLVLIVEHILRCMLTPNLQQLQPSNTTVPATMSSCQFGLFTCDAQEWNEHAYLNKCNTLLFTTGPPSTSCKMLKRGFAKAFLSSC